MADPFADLVPNNFADLVPEAKKGKQPITSFNDPRGAVLTAGSGAVALPVSGIAGLIGTIAGLVPGGESPLDKGARFVRGTQDALTIDPVNEASARTLETVGNVGESVSKGLSTIPAAFASFSPQEDLLAAQQFNRESTAAGEERFRRIVDTGVSNSVLDATGSPALATLFDVGPAALSAIAFRSSPIKNTVVRKPVVSTDGPAVSVGKPSLDTPVDFTPKVSADRIINHIKRTKADNLANEILPDKEILNSAQRLEVDLNPEHYSTNVAYQEVIRALKAKGGTKLQAAEVKALDDIAKKADELVQNLGGSIDKSSVNDSILLQTRGTIENLSTKADTAYDAVRAAIPAQTRVDTGNIKQYLDDVLSDLGGDKSLLASSEKKLFNLINNKATEGSVTYAALDRARKDIGNGFNRKSGPFKDDDSGLLRRVYGVVSDTQNNTANAFGVGDIYASGRELVIKRKLLEDQAMSLFGRNMSGSLVPLIRGSATKLAKGDVTEFNKLMDALPEARRAEMASTVLGELFATGSRSGGGLGTGFVKAFESLNRNAEAKNTLFRHLPAEGRKRFNDIGRVLTGIVKSNAKSLANPSGTASGIVQALESESFLRRIYDVGRKIVPAESVSSSVGLPGAGTAGVVGGLFSKTKIPPVQAADEFLTSPEFSRAVKVAIDGDIAKANAIIENSPRYKKWLEFSANKEQLAATGFVSWLLEDDE